MCFILFSVSDVAINNAQAQSTDTPSFIGGGAEKGATNEVIFESVTTTESKTVVRDVKNTTAAITTPHPLEPVSLEYRIRISKFGNAVLGKVQSELTKTESGYAIESVTKAQGMALLLMQNNLKESCEFEVSGGRAVAHRYMGGTVKKNQYSVGYDWQNRKVNFSDKESLDMPQGYVVDNCIMWFATALQRGNLDEGELVYVVDGKSKRIRGYKLRIAEDETIDTPLGEKTTTKLVFERELRPNRTLTFWLSKRDQFLPVKIEESRKSRTTTFVISKLDS